MNPDNDISSEPLTRIVCAAIRHQATGVVIAGVRHYDPGMRTVILYMCETADNARTRGWYGCEQGFLTNTYEFVTREAAWKIAEAAGQIRPHPSVVVGVLHSEDCW